jgi:glutamate formiminotransferase
LRPDRRNLEDVRRGQFELLREESLRNPDRAPDVGAAGLHPSAGAVIVGARKVLIAYNILLSTADASIAQEIARAIRFSSGGLRNVKALGLELKARGRAQVSINLTDFEETPIHRVFEMVRLEAKRHGCSIVGSEIVGLAPRKALEMAAAYFLQLPSPVPVLEERLQHALDAQAANGISVEGSGS